MLLKNLVVSKCNVRELRTEDDVTELADSIKECTLMSKVVLRARPKDDKYEIISGSRRYKALVSLFGEDYDLPESDYIIKDNLEDGDAVFLSIEENQCRKNLSPMELNRAALRLNQMGFKDSVIAKKLSIGTSRLKRIFNISTDLNRMPEKALEELKKPVDEARITDAHWQEIRKVEDEAVLNDVVDYILDKEVSARDVPNVVKSFERKMEKGDGEGVESSSKESSSAPAPGGPLEYVHKGQLVLEKQGDKEILKVLGAGEDKEVPVEQYLEYLRHPEKFKCMVSFKLKIKDIE